jgi:hypothetical protein
VTYRNKALLDSARDEACSYCTMADGTVVWAHCNSQSAGKGMGEKCHDLMGAYLCADCHDHYDGRAGHMSRAERHDLFKEAFFRTMIRVAKKLEEGKLKL